MVISGGEPVKRYCSMSREVDTMNGILAPRWRVTNLIAAGPSSTANDSRECGVNGEDVLDSELRPVMTRARYRNMKVDGPASLDAIGKQLGKIGSDPKRPDTLLIYIHGHGDKDPPLVEVGADKENLTADRLREMLGGIPESTRVILSVDACYSGGMLNALRGPDGRFRRNACGFSASSPREWTADGSLISNGTDAAMRDPLAALSESADADFDGQVTFGEVHRRMRTGAKRWSMPLSLSDVFLADYADRHPARPGRRRDEFTHLDHCLYAASGLSRLTSGLDEPLRTAAPLLLAPQLARLHRELSRQYATAGIPEGYTDKQVQKRIDENRAKADAAEAATIPARDAVFPARKAYLEKKLGPRDAACWRALKAETNQTSTPPGDVAACTGLPAQPQARRAEFARLDELFQRTRASANWANPEFANFAKNEGQGRWPADVLDQENATASADQQWQVYFMEQQKLQGTLKSVNALERMVEQNPPDNGAIMDYLNILECEETPIGKAIE